MYFRLKIVNHVHFCPFLNFFPAFQSFGYICRMLRFAVFSCCFLLFLFARAQQPAHFMFGEKQFEGVHIYSIIQDHELNYWFATNEGVYKHDGYSFELVECDEMLGRSVFGFVINSKGVIYCHNLNQQVFQLKNGKMSLVFELPDKGASLTIVVTKDDQLFVSSSSNHYLLNSDNALIYAGKKQGDRGFINGNPFVTAENEIFIHQIASEKLLIFKNGKPRMVTLRWTVPENEPKDLNLSFFELNGEYFAVSMNAKNIYRFNVKDYSLTYERSIFWEESDELLRYVMVGNRFWVTSLTAGLRVMDEQLNDLFQGTKCFPHLMISYIYRDNEGNYLLGTFDNGIVVVPDLNIKDRIPLLNEMVVTRLEADGDRCLFMGNQSGEINVFDQEILEFSKSSQRISNLFYWKERDVLITDMNSVTLIDCKTKKRTTTNLGSLKGVTQIDAKRLLIGLNVGLVELSYDSENKEYKKSDFLIEGRVYALDHERKTGYSYISSIAGLSCRKPNGSIVQVRYRNKIVNALSVYADGDVTYITTSKNGVLCFSKGKFIRQFRPQQMGSDLLITKMRIHNQKIYAITQLGLVVMDLKGSNQHFINKSRGLAVNRIIDFEIFRGKIWVTHGKGVQQFDLNYTWSDMQVPRLVLSKVRVNDQDYLISNPGKFNADQKQVSFTFRSPTLRNRDNIRYHYKLVGLSNMWSVNAYENNKVTYNSLAPGSYTLVVKVENNGVFSPTKYYSFSIAAPFYLRTWFILLCLLILILVVSLYYRRLLANQKRKSQRINELNTLRLTAIQSQMNPHFIFNSLNSIQDLVLKGDVDNSYTFITKFSDLVRRTLSYSEKDFIDFEQEVKLLELYLSLEKLRFRNELTYSIETNGIQDIQIPPMLIQPFLENALIHGLLHREGKKELSVYFRMDTALICEITDNGVGRKRSAEIKERQKSQHESFSTQAIKKRFEILESHFQSELGVEYTDMMDEDGQPMGTKVILKLPTKHTY